MDIYLIDILSHLPIDKNIILTNLGHETIFEGNVSDIMFIPVIYMIPIIYCRLPIIHLNTTIGISLVNKIIKDSNKRLED